MSLVRRFLLMDMLFEGGRMFVGGVSVAYLMSQGISLADIALIKALQAAVVFTAEVPTGIFGDRWGRKWSLICSLISAVIGFSLYLFGSVLLVYLLGEVFLALSLCFWSGSYEAWASSETEIEKSPESTRQFFHTNFSLNQMTVVIFGFIGGFVSGQNHFKNSYFGALTVMVLLLLIVLSTKETKLPVMNEIHEQTSISYFKVAMKYSMNDDRIRSIMTISILLQLLVQPLMHYWQPLFLSIKPELQGSSLGVIFALYSGATALVNYVARKKESLPIGGLLAAWMALYIGMGFSSGFLLVLALFVGQHMIYSVLRARYSSQLVLAAPKEMKASIMSINSFISRLGMFTSLFILHKMLENKSLPTIGDYHQLYLVLGSFGILGLGIGYFLKSKNLKISSSITSEVVR